MADFEIPTRESFLQEADKLWHKISNAKKDSSKLLKLCFGTDDHEKFVLLQTEHYNHVFGKGKKFAKEQVEGSLSAIKIALERLDESKENHDKAMTFSTDKQEEQLEDTERKVRTITKQKKVF